MRKTFPLFSLAILLLLIAGASPAAAQFDDENGPPERWMELHWEAESAYEAWQLEDAERLARQALSEVADGKIAPQSPRTESLKLLSSILMTRERFDESAELLRELLLGFGQAEAPEDERDWLLYERVDVMRRLAETLIRDRQFDEAERLFLQLKDLLLEIYEGDSVAEANPLVELARLHMRQGRARDAVNAIERAITLWEPHTGADNPSLAPSVHIYAEALFRAGDYEKAGEQFERLARMYRAQMGPGNEFLPGVLSRRALALEIQERWEDAADVYEEALDLYRDHLGAGDHEILWAIRGLAHCEEMLGAVDAAERRTAELTRLIERVYGDASHVTANALSDHARLLGKLGRESDEQAALDRAAQVRKRADSQANR